MIAHTGLDAAGALDGFLHPLLGPDHLLAMLSVGVIAALTTSRRIAWFTPAAFVGAMLVGGLFGIAGVELPAVELVIAASVVALGLIVVVAADVRAWWLPVVAAGFGLMHGHAHGAEAPNAGSPVAYVVAFVLMTVLLHLVGLGVGTLLRRSSAWRVAGGSLVVVAGASLLIASA